jgi:hypothetical protein
MNQQNTEQEKGSSFVELQASIEKMQDNLDAMQREAERILKKTGMTTEQMENYVNNPSNFSKEEWDRIESAKKEVKRFEEDMFKALGKDPEEMQKQAIKEKERKQKQKQRLMSPKKKNWIPIS